MKTLAAAIAAVGLVLAVSACEGPTREEPQSQGSVFNPVCMPDGSVVLNQKANADGTFGDPRASYDNCTWNKKK